MRGKFSSRFVVRLVAMLTLAGTFAILGCSDDNDEDLRNVDIRALSITDANAAMLGNEDFPFTNGVGAFGTVGTSTTVAFDDTATRADISAGDLTASAGAEYGSCTFIIGVSEFERPHPLAPGREHTFQRCTVTIVATEVPVGGDPVTGIMILNLGLVTSEETEVDVQIDEDGRLFVNEVDTGIIITGSEGDED